MNTIEMENLAALDKSFEVGQLSTSQRQALIVLTQKKKEKNKSLIKNWRSISPIIVDSQIAFKSLASRMKQFG